MTAGKRDQRVTVQRFTSTDDGYGGQVEAWTDLAIRWCSVEPMSGRERNQAQQTESPANYRVTLPWDSVTKAITTADRVVWNDKTGNIRFIADAGPRPIEAKIDVEFGVAA
ncbi:MAG: phage head closure protein [Alphaproteobacteria bacterium]|nr:phage head closure protein [Alphaproteobacteria bacterium]